MTGPEVSNALIVVAKQPAPGRTKTRLSPPLQPEQASKLYECFLTDTLDLIRQVELVQPVVAFLPAGAEAYFHQLASDFDLIQQQGPDLGVRLDNAISSYLSRGYSRVVIMNSDSPTLPAAYLSQAFDSLEAGADVVLGPCDDGGYYLIGVKQPIPRLLQEVQMSTPTVAADTIAMAVEDNLKVHLLPNWYDVDDAASLIRLAEEVNNGNLQRATHTRHFILNHLTDSWLKEG
jgi:rSAM/selenodomain-associated transferase 1